MGAAWPSFCHRCRGRRQRADHGHWQSPQGARLLSLGYVRLRAGSPFRGRDHEGRLRGRPQRFDRCPANDRNRRYLVIAARSGQGLLTEPIAGAQVGRWELVILPPFASFADRCTFPFQIKSTFRMSAVRPPENHAAGAPGHAPGGCAGRCVPGQSARQYEGQGPMDFAAFTGTPGGNAHGVCQMLYRHGWSVTL